MGSRHRLPRGGFTRTQTACRAPTSGVWSLLFTVEISLSGAALGSVDDAPQGVPPGDLVALIERAVERATDRLTERLLAELRESAGPMLTTEQAASYLSVSERTLESLVSAGKISTTRITPRTRRFAREHLDAVLRAHVAR